MCQMKSSLERFLRDFYFVKGLKIKGDKIPRLFFSHKNNNKPCHVKHLVTDWLGEFVASKSTI